MTKQEIVQLQIKLNKLGYGPIQVDGQYGKNTEAAYRKYLDELDPSVPTVIPPPEEKWWMSRALIGALATIIVGIIGMFGYQLDNQFVTEMIISAITVITGIITVIGTIKRKAPIDTKYINPFNQPKPLTNYSEITINYEEDARGIFSDKYS